MKLRLLAAGAGAGALLLAGWLLLYAGDEPAPARAHSPTPAQAAKPRKPAPKPGGAKTDAPPPAEPEIALAPAPPVAVEEPVPSSRDLPVDKMTAWAWQGKLFNNDGTINEVMFAKFGFTPEERAFFDGHWRDFLMRWQRVERLHMRQLKTAADGSTSIEVNAFPEVGGPFRKNFVERMDGKVPPSFVRFFTELSHDDTTGTFADWGRSRQNYHLKPAQDGGWTLQREVLRFSEDRGTWVLVNAGEAKFTTMPERFSELFRGPLPPPSRPDASQ